MAVRVLRALRSRPLARAFSTVASPGSRWPSEGSGVLLYEINRTKPHADRSRRLEAASPVSWDGKVKVTPSLRGPALFEAIRGACIASLPGWGHAAAKDVCVERLAGTSNRNFKVRLTGPSQGMGDLDTVLFRCYGSGLELLYDQDLEVEIAKMLSSCGLGVQIFAQGSGWRIEQWWHDAVPLPNSRMKEPAILEQVASQVGRLHRISATKVDFPDRLRASAPASLTRLSAWGRACALAAPRAGDGPAVDELRAECAWLTDFLTADDEGIPATGLDVVFSHWDVQENNVLLVPCGLKFIDFEYADMDYQAFDIATYFVECSIDLVVKEYPFYKVDLSCAPTEAERHHFCAAHLSAYLGTAVGPGDPRVALLSQRAKRFELAVHLLWTMWSVVRASQASQAPLDGFDCLHYGRCRWSLYKQAKRALLDKP